MALVTRKPHPPLLTLFILPTFLQSRFRLMVRGVFDAEKSDIDLLVEIEATDLLEKGEKLISFWDNFEIFFHRKVDLLIESSIRNPYL
ncbi:MAG: hypothetical protein RBR28_09815 [Lentimicrobium sp.]|nr:hypothetical protein [Lentimicrobium sp.]